jgi:protocatechuate 3,4-dioxygenase beta subunit
MRPSLTVTATGAIDVMAPETVAMVTEHELEIG